MSLLLAESVSDRGEYEHDRHYGGGDDQERQEQKREWPAGHGEGGQSEHSPPSQVVKKDC